MKNSLMRNKTAKIRRRLKNRIKNMKNSFMMITNRKKDKNKDQKQAAIQEEERRNKLKRTKKYCNTNK